MSQGHRPFLAPDSGALCLISGTLAVAPLSPAILTCISVAYLWVWPSLPVTFLPLSDIEAFPFLLLVFSSDLEL